MKKPNILLIMVDQMRYPCFGYGKDHGFIDPLKRIFGFQESAPEDQEFREFFPGFTALTNTNNAVIFNKHKAASAACVPSRTALFTGQYGTRTGALQTDGVFKDGASDQFPWLDPQEFPTLGHWMRENGYSTHYFGKWHVSGEATNSLEDYGFSDWELSYPDPHGSLPNNLGYYRDYQFEDLATSFLRRQGLGVPFDVASAEWNVAEANSKDKDKDNIPEPPETAQPWFAVASFTNPHDIGSYPGLPRQVCNSSFSEDDSYALTVPPQNVEGELPKNGTMAIHLNKLNFPQENAKVPPTWNENLLNNKPNCQFDYAYKMGLALASKAGWLAAEKAAEVNPSIGWDARLKIGVKTALATDTIGVPFALTSKQELASRAFIQYYGYLMHEVDQHIHGVLKALDESGQADDTIVIFCPDHGEYAASHGMMMEKWHSAYEEYVHVPLVVRFPENYTGGPGCLKQIQDVVTSHIDILPTVLGLAGVNADSRNEIKTKLKNKKNKQRQILEPVGRDLSPLILGKQTAIEPPRKGVLFINHDTITEPLDAEASFDGSKTSGTYEIFKAAVEELLNPGTHIEGATSESYPDGVQHLALGSVRRPSLVNCVMSDDNWKLVRYFEPSDNPNDYTNNNQFELYDLNTDPNEQSNLVVYDDPSLKAISGNQKIQAKANDMKTLLEKLEGQMLCQSVA